jgi:hypothetical protein
MREKTSIIWTMPRKELENLINESSTLSSVLIKMGYVNIEGNHRTLKNRIEKENIDISSLIERGKLEKIERVKGLHRLARKEDSEIFKKDSKFSRKDLKKRIFKDNLIDYVCKKCNNKGEWNGEKLVLHLEHINGTGNDNRLENLCFLCPNCHSQTSTYAGKNIKLTLKREKKLSIQRTCPKCGKEKDRQADMCRECYRIFLSTNSTVGKPDKETLKDLISRLPMTKVASIYGVSDSAIKKWAKKYGVFSYSKYSHKNNEI